MNVIARNLKNVVVPAALVGLSLLSGIKADAQAITPTLTGSSVAGGITTFTYDIVLSSDSTATTAGKGTSLTMFDFFGLTGPTPTFVAIGGATFTVTTPGSGLDAANTIIGQTDDPGVANIALSYTGPDIVATATPITLGTLTAESTGVNSGEFTPFSSLSLKTSNGSLAANQSFVFGPNPSPVTTPEPGAIAMLMGMGISGSAFVLRRRRRA